MKDRAERIMRVRPGIKPLEHFIVESDGSGTALKAWDKRFDPIPTDAELLAVDLTQPTAEELRLRDIKRILRDDVPDAWRTSTNAQQRVAWALKWALIESRRDFTA
jgi:hypothetical protein